MATILLVANDGPVAGIMVRTLRQAGHTPIFASDARSALQEALGCPDIVLFDLGLPDLPMEKLLRHLTSQPETADIPVLVITESTEAAARLRGSQKGSLADILLTPVSGAQLREAVGNALAGQGELDADALRLARQRQRELIRRLILECPDPLVFHVHRRLCADRTRRKSPTSEDVLSWAEIAEWAKREGVLDAEQARLLRRVPLAAPQTGGEDSV